MGLATKVSHVKDFDLYHLRISGKALCWTADATSHEFLINGLKRGVSPKHRYREKSRPSLSRMAMLQLYSQLLEAQGLPPPNPTSTYHAVKESMENHRKVKVKLIGQDGIFSGWVRSGAEWQAFDLNQNTPQPEH
ncbi:hypothetical protein DXG01_007431 [Tephrocybe rancida]|nr:hypothetical protein DXG01_007431 [Tephrocybe rancida]